MRDRLKNFQYQVSDSLGETLYKAEKNWWKVEYEFKESLGCLGTMAVVCAPVLIDMSLLYLASTKYPELAGIAFLGAPIAFAASLGLAESL